MDFDCVVVGAGPSGSTAAKILAEQGINVLLIDKAIFPRDKPCGGGLPLRVLQQFPYIKDIGVIETYAYGGYLHPPSLQYKVKIHKTEPIIAMVLRKNFDQELVNIAIENGSEFWDNTSLKNVTVTTENVRMTLNEGTHIDTHLVIGADGFFSTVAQKTGLGSSFHSDATSVVEEFIVKKEIMDEFFTDQRWCHIFSKIHHLSGYGWVFPKQTHLNIGIAEYRLNTENKKEVNKNIKEIFDDFLSFLIKRGIIPEDIKSNALKGGMLPVKPLKKTYSDHVLLCGDAAGFINPVSGEGIYYALASGRLAGLTAGEALQVNDTGERFLSRYEKRWKNDFGKEIKIMLRSTKQWKKTNENVAKLMSKDSKLAELLFSTMTGQKSICELRWKIVYRYLYALMKYSLRGQM